MFTCKKTVITSIGHYVPEQSVPNEDFERIMDTSSEWIEKRTGIKERHFVEPGTRTSTLACIAAEVAILKSGIPYKDIDYIIATTIFSDYYFPGIAPLIQRRMGFRAIPALDLRTQCSGFVYGISTADALIKSEQAKKILLVCAEVQSQSLDFSTRGREMAVLFGDGAAAVVLEAQERWPEESMRLLPFERGIIDSVLGSDGSGAEYLYLKSPGTATRKFIQSEDVEAGLTFPTMDGANVFFNAVQRMSEVIIELLRRNQLRVEDIDLFFPHQANIRICENIRERFNIPKEKMYMNIENFGNTTSASIPICLSEAFASGKLKRGQLIVCVAFGAGFIWGANLIRW